MGNYHEVLMKREELRDIDEDKRARPTLFGNPFKTFEKSQRASFEVVDEAEEEEGQKSFFAGKNKRRAATPPAYICNSILCLTWNSDHLVPKYKKSQPDTVDQLQVHLNSPHHHNLHLYQKVPRYPTHCHRHRHPIYRQEMEHQNRKKRLTQC